MFYLVAISLLMFESIAEYVVVVTMIRNQKDSYFCNYYVIHSKYYVFTLTAANVNITFYKHLT